MFFKPAAFPEARFGWIGCLGAKASAAFADLPAQRWVAGPHGALAAFGSSACAPILSADAQGSLRAVIGDDQEAGCSATLASDGTGVTLTCDPFGLHTVFIARVEEASEATFWFASDLTLLRHYARLPATTLCPDALHGYLCCSYVPTPTTLYAGIETLPAGSRTTFDATGAPTPTTAPRPWNEVRPFQTDETAAVEALRQKLRAAVERQLAGEREVGVFLSGGLDSSLVAALLAEAGARLHLYTLDFGPPFDGELSAARAVAAHLKQPLHIVPARVADVAKALRATAGAMQQPFGDAVTVPLMLLGKAASRHVDLVFNGEFGDQLFGGWANKPMIAAELYAARDYRREAAYMATFHRFHGLTNTLYTPRLRQATASRDAENGIRAELEAGSYSSLLHRLRAANLRLKGAQNIGPRARQLAEACSLRSHSPFCDRELTDWTFTCPPEWFLQGACEKYLLKRAAEPFLPAEIVWREKRGMGVPATEWCLGGLRRSIRRVLHPRRLEQDGLFRPEAVRALCRGSDTPGEFRTRRLGEKLWTLLMLHLWLDAQPGSLSICGKGSNETADEMYPLRDR
jgi:asparagine synthase (glutamine-hydrolysing)